MTTARVRLPGAAAVVAVLAFGGVCTAGSAPADDTVLSGMTWMTGFPATWNAAAPKLAFDGLHAYAVLCGYQGSPNTCSIARNIRSVIVPVQRSCRTMRTASAPFAKSDNLSKSA